MNYSEAVAQAAAKAGAVLKRIVSREADNWEIARLTWENTHERGSVFTQTDTVNMTTWCGLVRDAAREAFSTPTGYRYKRMWQWRVDHGAIDHLDNGLSWSSIYDLIDGHDTTVRERMDETENQITMRSIVNATPQQKREVVTRLLAEPEIADAVMTERDTRQAIYGAMQRKEQRAEVRNETIRASDPVIQRLDKEAALIDLERVMSKAAEEIRALVAAIGTLPKRSDDAVAPHYFIRQAFTAIEDAVGGVRTLLETGTNDLDHFLEGVLKGEQ